MNTFKKIANVFGWFVVLFLFCYGIYGGWQMTRSLWPGLHEDANLYSTVIINRASGNGNTFDVYVRSLLLNNTKEFNSHGQLYYPVLAALLSAPSYEALLKFLHQSNLFAYVISFYVFMISSCRSLRIRWVLGAFFGLVGAWSMVSVLHYLQGRPEHGIPFVLLGVALIREAFKMDKVPDWLSGIQIGVVGAISPLPGLILAFASVFDRALQPVSNSFLIKSVFIRGLFGVAAWLVSVLLVYKNSLIDLLKNTLTGTETASNVFFTQQLPLFWLKTHFAPGLGALLVLTLSVAILIASLSLLRRGPIVPKIAIILCALFIGQIIWMHGVAFSATNYCFMPFLPSVALWLINLSYCTKDFKNWQIVIFKKLVPVGLFICLFGPSFGYFRTAFMQYYTLKDGVKYSSALDRIKKLKSELSPNESILIDGWKNARTAVVLDEIPWSFKAMTDWNLKKLVKAEEKLDFRAKYFVCLQFYNPDPPVVEGFNLVENQFLKTDSISILGVQIKGSTQGYGYAIYTRDNK
jgi:hypothetical protein